MTPKEKLKKLIGLPEEKFFSDEELEIEYETEIAHLNSYRSWLEKLHDEWQKTKDYSSSLPNISANTTGKLPGSTSVDFLNVSTKATRVLKKLGIKVMSDFEKFTEEELIPAIGFRPVKVISSALEKYGVSFSTEKISNTIDIPRDSMCDCAEENECKKEDSKFEPKCKTTAKKNNETETLEENEDESNEKLEAVEETVDTKSTNIEEVFADEDDDVDDDSLENDDTEPDFSDTFSRSFDDSIYFDYTSSNNEETKEEENTESQDTYYCENVEIPF